jgi:hypothetical protein
MKVIVITGSRQWPDELAIRKVLEGADGLIVGDCPTGADAYALSCAKAWDIVFKRCEVPGARASEALRARNQVIADEAVVARDQGFDVQCHAFPLPQSRGTHHCAGLLRKAGFHVEMHRG